MSMFGTIIDRELPDVDQYGTLTGYVAEVDIAENAAHRDIIRVTLPDYMTRSDLVQLARDIVAQLSPPEPAAEGDDVARWAAKVCHYCGGSIGLAQALEMIDAARAEYGDTLALLSALKAIREAFEQETTV